MISYILGSDEVRVPVLAVISIVPAMIVTLLAVHNTRTQSRYGIQQKGASTVHTPIFLNIPVPLEQGIVFERAGQLVERYDIKHGGKILTSDAFVWVCVIINT
jgi:hypothetical protein